MIWVFVNLLTQPVTAPVVVCEAFGSQSCEIHVDGGTVCHLATYDDSKPNGSLIRDVKWPASNEGHCEIDLANVPTGPRSENG